MDRTIKHFEQKIQENESILHLKGSWTISHATTIEDQIKKINIHNIQKLIIDCQNIEELDSAGSLAIKKIENHYQNKKIAIQYIKISPKFETLFSKIHALKEIAFPEEKSTPSLRDKIQTFGKKIIQFGNDFRGLISFFGEVLVVSGKAVLRPLQLRWTSIFYHVKIMGVDALPITGLLTFLIGIVLAYQGATQLQRFGADIYTVNLVGIATLRELGIILVAVIVAGRTGSAITAQIGTMSVNEEIDALKTMGIHPLEILVIPRILALVICFPLLTLYGNFMALIGGGAGCWILLNIHPYEYINQLHQAVPLSALWVGLSKTPLFAFVIALVGCFEGLKVKGSAESVGIHTTQSVVKSLFLIIVLDAFFSIIFTLFDI